MGGVSFNLDEDMDGNPTAAFGANVTGDEDAAIATLKNKGGDEEEDANRKVDVLMKALGHEKISFSLIEWIR